MQNVLRPLFLFALIACAPAASAPASEQRSADPPAAGAASDAPGASATPPRAQAAAQEEFDQEHTAWTAVLRAHVHGGSFDYAALKKDPQAFEAYLATIDAVTPEELASWTREQRFAFWLNAYNAHTIQKVIDNYPLKSIRDLDGLLGLNSVFDSRFIDMPKLDPEGKGRKLSLNDIENEILRKRFEDARVHASINCASKSCPNLRNEAFVADRLDDQLDDQMRRFVADTTKNRFGEERSRVSEIFKWFKDDFVRDAGDVRAFIARFASPENAEFVRESTLEYLSYDWSLNDVAKD